MDLLKTGIGLTKTVKNASRLREIVTVFWRNGFDEFIVKSNLQKYIPNFALPRKAEFSEDSGDFDIWQSIGYRLRKSFEELGPSFIKLGQILSTREDLFDQNLIIELKKLQDHALGVDFSLVRQTIEKSLGHKIEDIFSSFDEDAIGKASIGLVYRATLKNGDDVVVKVRRPNIKKILNTDYEIISFIAENIEKISDEVKYLGISRAIDDFFKNIERELNFHIEKNNAKILKNNLQKIDQESLLIIPKIYEEYTRDDILIMERLKGKPFNKIKDIKEEAGLDKKLEKSVSLFIKSLLSDGFFHADLHGGNFFSLDSGKIGIIDFGLMGNLSRKSRINLVAILYAMLSKNFENLVYEFLDVVEYESIPNIESLIRDLEDILSPSLGLSAMEVDVSLLFKNIVKVLSKHKLFLPREWFIIFRALMTLDGVGKSLNYDVNIYSFISEEIEEIMSALFDKKSLMEDAIWIGRDTLNSLRTLPRNLKWAMKEFANKKYALDINLLGVNQEITSISKALFFMGLMVFSSVLTFVGAFFIKNENIQNLSDIPIISLIFWTLALLSIIRASFFLKR